MFSKREIERCENGVVSIGSMRLSCNLDGFWLGTDDQSSCVHA